MWVEVLGTQNSPSHPASHELGVHMTECQVSHTWQPAPAQEGTPSRFLPYPLPSTHTGRGKGCGAALVGSRLWPGLAWPVWAAPCYLRVPCAEKGPEIRAEPMSAATDRVLTLGSPEARASESGEMTGPHAALWSISGQVSWVRGCL